MSTTGIWTDIQANFNDFFETTLTGADTTFKPASVIDTNNSSFVDSALNGSYSLRMEGSQPIGLGISTDQFPLYNVQVDLVFNVFNKNQYSTAIEDMEQVVRQRLRPDSWTGHSTIINMKHIGTDTTEWLDGDQENKLVAKLAFEVLGQRKSSRVGRKFVKTLNAGATAALVLNSTSAQAWAELAFPGAVGFAKNSYGGSGRHLWFNEGKSPSGIIYHVTNLEDNDYNVNGSGSYDRDAGTGEGNLRYGLESINEPRIIVFDVGGIIPLTSSLTIINSYCTIAGETAPGSGVCITNAGIVVGVSGTLSDIVIRHIGIFPGDLGAISGLTTIPTSVTSTVKGMQPAVGESFASIDFNNSPARSNWYVRDPNVHIYASQSIFGGADVKIDGQTGSSELSYTGDNFPSKDDPSTSLVYFASTLSPAGHRCLMSDRTTTASKVMVDHCSFAWAMAELYKVSDGDYDWTFQNSMIYEGFDKNLVPDGQSSKLWNHHNTASAGGGATLYKVIGAHAKTRLPRFAGNDTMDEMVNCIWYNWSEHDGSGLTMTQTGASANIVGCVAISGNDSTKQYWFSKSIQGMTAGQKIYVSDNIGSSQGEEGWNSIADSEGHLSSSTEAFTVPTQISGSDINVTSTSGDWLANLGMRPANRSSHDHRIIGGITSLTGNSISSMTAHGGVTTSDWPTVSSTFVAVADPFAKSTSGYTNIEIQLQGLANALLV